MPYIIERRRDDLEANGLARLCGAIEERNAGKSSFSFDPGDLAYIVMRLLLAAAPAATARFTQRNAMMGAVDEARMEYRRRVHEPAEDRAIAENGDVLP
jgi:hypothetical protein